MVVNHGFRQFCWDHLWRDTFWLCTLQSQLCNAGIVYGMVYKKMQHHGKQLPNQTHQVLTLFWGDRSPIRIDPSYQNRHCTYSFCFGHSSIKTNLYLIRQAWELLEDSTLSLLLACSMLYPGGLVEDFAHGQLSVNWVYWIFVCHSVLRRGLGVKETGAALLEKH